MLRFLIIILLAGLLSACTAFYPPSIDTDVSGLPSRFSLFSEKTEPYGKWWQDFQSDELNTLIEGALSDNFSIQEAWARFMQASLTAEISGAAKKPNLNYSGSGSYSEQKVKGQNRSSNDQWSLGLNASYEVDLWGRVLAGQKNALLKAEASEKDLQTAFMIVAGEMAENWITLSSVIQQQNLFQEQLQLQNKLLELIELRFPNGQASALDIYQQKQAIERLNAALVPLISKQESLIRKLAFLSGKASLDNLELKPDRFPDLKTIPKVGLPADLLAARPDIKAAGLRLKAAEWEVTAAKADRLPALKITGSHQYGPNDIDALFDNWLLNLAANVTGPIFDGNRRSLEVERTQKVIDERLAMYRKTVFTAVKEVEDALADELQYLQTLELLDNQLALSDKTMREARNRYLSGSSDFLNVLREELNSLQLQQDVITAQEKRIIARINLHKALGGSWFDEIVPKRVPHATSKQ